MKKIRMVIVAFCFLKAIVLFGQQKCDNYACMMANAKKYLREGNYEAAFNSAMAAKRYSGADVNEVDALASAIFTQINLLRDRAEAATRAADAARKEAVNSSHMAEQKAG